MPAQLTAQDIYYKEFSIDKQGGYSSDEVDSFLDQVIEDYQDFEEHTKKYSSALVSCDHKIKELSEENTNLKKETSALNEQIHVLRNALQEAKVKLERATVEIRSLKEEAREEYDEQDTVELQPQDLTLNAQEEATDPIEELARRVARLEEAVFNSFH